jgi:hypothetical protein
VGSRYTLCFAVSVLPQVHPRVVCVLCRENLKILMPKHLFLFMNVLFENESLFEEAIYFTAASVVA